VELLNCDPNDLPRPLRRLAALATDTETDLVSLGGAMVATFTGTSFDDQVLPAAVHRTLTPVPADLETYGARMAALRHDAPDVVEAIVAASPQQQRRLANWAARVAAVEAGVASEPGVRALLEQNAWDVAPTLPPQLDGLLARWQRERERWGNRHEDHTANASSGALEGCFLQQKVSAGEALKASTHPDPLEAALQVMFSAVCTVGLSRRERGGKFVKDKRGRRRVDERPRSGPRLGPRSRGLADLALEALADQTGDWSAVSSRLPVPLTETERQDAIQRDQMRQARGDFNTYVIVPLRHR
jgi:hypothetical protein